jgi:hypothetical protein
MNTNYMRVTPRDLFNEAKLLKCMGQLSLKILDCATPCNILLKDTGNPFKIALMDDGFLTITNIKVKIQVKKNIYYPVFRSLYNSKSNYPLFCTHENCDHRVFDESGEFDQEFLEFIKTLD